MILAKLTGRVALRLEQLGDRDVARLDAFLGARQADLEIARAEAALARDERGAPGGAALLAVPVGEERALLGDAVDIGRTAPQHASMVSADIGPADIIAPDHQYVGLVGLRLAAKGKQTEYCKEEIF